MHRFIVADRKPRRELFIFDDRVAKLIEILLSGYYIGCHDLVDLTGSGRLINPIDHDC
jgi:hypothetical protein